MFDMMPWTYSGINHPFTDMDRMVQYMFGEGPQIRNFQTDIRDNGSSYTLEAELPGFKKEDISIDINGDQLTIEAQHTEDNSEKDGNGSYLRRERYYGSYSRSFDISQIRADEIDASYDNGVLKLEMPKKNAVVSTSRRLKIQ